VNKNNRLAKKVAGQTVIAIWTGRPCL